MLCLNNHKLAKNHKLVKGIKGVVLEKEENHAGIKEKQEAANN